jgi:hypothetical protein
MAKYLGKRSRSAGAGVVKRRRMVVPGRTRVSGYYGRYNRAGGNEVKFHDNVTNATVATAGGIIDNIPTGIASGTEESQRIGRQITGTRLNFNGILTLPASAANATDVVRIMVVMDKQCNGATFSATDLLDTSGNFLSYRNLENSKRFRVLYDKRFTLNATAFDSSNVLTAPFTRFFKGSIPLKGARFEYSGTTGSITELKSNNLAIFMQSEKGHAVVDMVSRFRYVG